MNLGLVTIHVALAIATGAFANIWSSLVFAMWRHYEYVLPEEAFRHSRFLHAFDAYAEETPRWLGLPGHP